MNRKMNYCSFKDKSGRIWWKSLKPKYNQNRNYRSLIEDIGIEKLQNKIIISSELPGKNNEMTRYFTVFNNYTTLGKYIESMPKDRRCFYEVILGRYPQKPHFDIDIDLKKYSYVTDEVYNEIIDEIITAIDESLLSNNIKLNIFDDIMLFTSHSDVKKSCHIVINNYFHSNASEAKGFYQDVVKRLTVDYKEFVDASVYSSKQNFRLVNCTKYGKNRYKTFNKTWKFSDEDIVYTGDITNIFKSSLVSWIEDCKQLPLYQVEKKNKVDPLHTMTFDYLANKNNPNSNEQREYRKLNDEEVMEAFNVFKIYYVELTKSKVFQYKIREVDHSRITLNRTRPGYCPICKRHHESDHCSIFVSYSKKVYYKCFRDIDVTDTSLEIGNINGKIINTQNKFIKSDNNKNKSIPVVNLSFNLYDKKDSVVVKTKNKKVLPDVLEGIKMMQQKNGYSNDITEMDRVSNEIFSKKR